MFRSVRFYSLGCPWPETEQELSERLAAAGFKPCGPYTEKSSGFESPTGDDAQGLVRRVGGADLMRIRTQARILPAAALNEALEVRLQEYRDKMGQEPGRRTKRQLKEQTRDDLLPKALVKSERTSALFILSERVLVVGTSSQARAEQFLEQLRLALGNLEAVPLEFNRPFGELLTRTFIGDAPREFVLARECRMRDPKDAKSTVRWTNVDLGQPTVQRCLKDGMEITHLAFEFANVLSGVLDEKGVLSKIALLGLEDAPATEMESDPLAKLDAEIALFGGTVRQLLQSLHKALGGEPGPARHKVIGTAAEPVSIGLPEPGRASSFPAEAAPIPAPA